MPIILAIQETEMRSIKVPSQPRARPCLEKPITKKGWWSGSSDRVPP
jgi:hypothetical protein